MEEIILKHLKKQVQCLVNTMADLYFITEDNADDIIDTLETMHYEHSLLRQKEEILREEKEEYIEENPEDDVDDMLVKYMEERKTW